MIRCGLWATPRRLLAAVMDEDGKFETLLSAKRTEEGRWSLMAAIGPEPELVLTDAIARSDPIGGVALRCGVRVWTVPAALVEGVRQLADLTTRHPKLSAVLLARWPDAPVLRGYLRLALPTVDECQVTMW